MSRISSVLLREVTDRDVVVFFGHQAEREASEMAAFPARDRAAHFEHWAKQRANPSTVLRSIEYAGEVAGNIVSWVENGEREVGYWIGKDFWGKGIATDALTEFTAEVTERPLFAYVAEANIGSRRVLSKCGFQETGKVIETSDAPLLQYIL
jgi:RimJ/RimL family protein N-acetyltransferase